MRVSEGSPCGKIVELYKPELFQEHEEVIVFTREDFNRTYTSMKEQIDYINKINLHLDKSDEWKLLGYWPKIMQRVYRININMNLIFKKEPLQSYLDTYLFNSTQSSQEKIAVSEKEGISTINFEI